MTEIRQCDTGWYWKEEALGGYVFSFETQKEALAAKQAVSLFHKEYKSKVIGITIGWTLAISFLYFGFFIMPR
jgi:hypothetical protein